MIKEAARPGAPADPATPSPGAERLAPVRDLPGLAHACLLDASGGRVLAEIGADEGGATAAVLAWGHRAGAVATDRGRTLEDLIVTTDVAYHLVRAVGGVADGPWVYLRVRRDEGNLALARRRLAAITTAAPAGATPAPDPSPAVRSSSGPVGVPFPRRTPAATPAVPAVPSVPAAPPSRASPPAASPAPAPWARPPAGRTTAVPVAVPALPAPRAPAGPAAVVAARPQPPAEPARLPTTMRDSAGVLTQRWRTDPETLRRVLAGLLRLGPTA
ncbi:hypothetical protein [Actinomycetospora cinnamomea]|uniref:Uncharacterized protein n=1 Tax=Actinomycetospora cinnamomea TaxID=663609 RepID=A0A2U1FHU0_9PSEU|nr:hypothetical protein [Actinomycetospora cinnamomea]PVZ11721.1 hypothetical protein C8D89_10351 [Actinomycetospora cinnamomea]